MEEPIAHSSCSCARLYQFLAKFTPSKIEMRPLAGCSKTSHSGRSRGNEALISSKKTFVQSLFTSAPTFLKGAGPAWLRDGGQETTMTLKWMEDRLKMGTWVYVNHLLYCYRRKTVK
jgi:hypothetical protein